MALVAFVTADLFGGNEPQLSLAETLLLRGHEVTFLAHEGLESRIRERNCDFVRFDAWNARTDELDRILRDLRPGVCLSEFLLFAFHDAVTICPIVPICHFAYQVSRRSWTHLQSIETARRCLRRQSPLPEYFGLWRSSPMLLVMSDPTFDDSNRDDDWVHYVGPFLGSPDHAHTDESSQRHSRAIIVPSMNPLIVNKGRLQLLIAAALHENLEVVVSTSGTLMPDEFQPLNGVEIYDMIDMKSFLSGAAILITHAGHGGVMQGLASNVPLLCDPVRLDQPANAARVVELGVGLQLGATSTSNDAAELIRALISVPTFSRQSIIAVDSPMESNAADLIETLL